MNRRTAEAPVRGAADIVVDSAGFLGALSYLVPDTLTVRPGDAVQVGFGRGGTRNGIVLGPAANPGKAAKPVLAVHGRRADPRDVALARIVAAGHGVDIAAAAARLSPGKGRGADPIDAGEVRCTSPVTPAPRTSARRILLCPPSTAPTAAAAAEAARMADAGQVLVLCPTAADVAAVMSWLPSGAVRLDADAPRGAWRGFCDGTATIGVGTRSAAMYSAADLAGVIVVRPEHPGMVERARPRTHARDIASARTRARALPLTLVTARPGPADLAACSGHVDRLSGEWPTMTVADRSSADPATSGVPVQMRAAVAAARRAGRPIIVVAGRTTHIRRCRTCFSPSPDCPTCTAASCRHPRTCPRCAKTAIPTAGWTPERLRTTLGEDITVVTAAGLPDAGRHGPATVIVFDADALWHRGGWTPDVDAAGTIVEAAQAAGVGGDVVIGTWNPAHPPLRDLVSRHDPAAVARRAAAAARELGLPPYGRRITVHTRRKTRPDTSAWPGTVIGPVPDGDGAWTITVLCSSEQLTAAAAAVAAFTRRNRRTDVLVE